MVKFSLENGVDKSAHHDIKESFEALDIRKTGRLEIELAYTLLLGLGYITDYTKKDEFSPTSLDEAAKKIESAENGNPMFDDSSSGIRLETLLTIIATHPALSKGTNDFESFDKRCLGLIDSDKKGFIVASDVQRLGLDIEKTAMRWNGSLIQNQAELSIDEAKEMIVTTNRIFAADTARIVNENEKKGNQHQLHPPVFGKIFAPRYLD